MLGCVLTFLTNTACAPDGDSEALSGSPSLVLILGWVLSHAGLISVAARGLELRLKEFIWAELLNL